MKLISEKELRFSEWLTERRKLFRFSPIANPEEIVVEMCFCYLVAQSEKDKEEAAWLIHKLKPEYKGYIDKNYIDLDDEYERLVHSRIEKREKIAMLGHERRHQKRGDFALTAEQWDETCAFFDFCCVYCGSDGKLTYDHFTPFSKGGSFEQDNILPCCISCNSSKKNQEFEMWYEKQVFFSEDRQMSITKFINGKKQDKALN